MKKICFLALMAFTQIASVSAQKNSSDYDPMARPNIVKLNLSSLGYKTIGVQYERILGDKISVACQLRLMPKGSLPMSNTIDNLSDPDSSVTAGDWKMGSFAVTPEFRFYPKHAGKGFYLAPYLRYRTLSIDFPSTYYDDQSKLQSTNVKGNATSFMGGLMIGSQFNLGKMVTLDWFIIGLQYGVTKAKLDVTTTQTLSANDQADIISNLEDIKGSMKAFNDFSYTIGPNGGSIDGKFAALGFRGFGLNLGFKF